MANYKDLYAKHKLLVPLVLLLILCIKVFVESRQGTVESEGSTFLFSITSKHYYAFALVALNFIIYFAFRPLYKYSLILTFLLAVFGFISVVAIPKETTFNLGSMILSFEPTCFYLLLVFLFLTIDLKKMGSPKSQTTEGEAYKRTKTEVEIDKYKKLYKNKSLEDLKIILSEKTIRDTAREALVQIIKEGEQNSDPNR